MKAQEFLSQVDDAAVVAAIEQAETNTSGQIRVFVTHHEVTNAFIAAQRHFLRLGMDKTRARNGVLIFVAPKSHAFAIIGDQAVHEKCGDEFWKRVAGEMTGHFKQSAWTAAIVHGVATAGAVLAEHFPREADGVNELPDKVERD
jgi:uncharacterized membrane protein